MTRIARAGKAFWNFWARPIRAEPVAAFRVSIGLIVAVDTLVTLIPYAQQWFGAGGLYPTSSFEFWADTWGRWSIIGADWSVGETTVALWALVALALMSSFGLLTRFATIGLWALLMSFHVRNPLMLNAGDILLRISTFYLMLMPAGAAWSLDNVIRARLLRPVQPSLTRKLLALSFTHASLWGEVWRGERATGQIAPWSTRLAQIQIVVLYFFTGVDKLRGVSADGGVGDWVNGQAVAWAMSHPTIARFEFLAGWPWWVFAPATWITLGWEITFPLLVLWRRTRWYALSFGVLLHLGIWATMEVTHFSFTTLAYYWLFVPAMVLADMAGKATGDNERRKLILFYDGMCPVCKRSRRWVERLDWLNRVEYADIHDREFANAQLPDVSYAGMLKEMYVKRPDGQYYGGYDAFRALAPVLPLTWLCVPFMWLPGARWLGAKVYKFIARNRYRYAKCDNEFCSLHLQLLAGKEVTDETVQKIVELHEKYKNAKQPGSKPEPVA